MVRNLGSFWFVAVIPAYKTNNRRKMMWWAHITINCLGDCSALSTEKWTWVQQSVGRTEFSINCSLGIVIIPYINMFPSPVSMRFKTNCPELVSLLQSSLWFQFNNSLWDWCQTFIVRNLNDYRFVVAIANKKDYNVRGSWYRPKRHHYTG